MHLGLVISVVHIPQSKIWKRQSGSPIEVRLVTVSAPGKSADDPVMRSTQGFTSGAGEIPQTIHLDTPVEEIPREESQTVEVIEPDPSPLDDPPAIRMSSQEPSVTGQVVNAQDGGSFPLHAKEKGGVSEVAGAEGMSPTISLGPGQSGSSASGGVGTAGTGSTGSEGEGHDLLLSEFLAAVRARLEHAKRYPWPARLRQEEGTVLVEFQITPEGKALDIHVATPSPSLVLNEEAIATVERVRDFPLPPRGFEKGGVKITVPITYKLY